MIQKIFVLSIDLFKYILLIAALLFVLKISGKRNVGIRSRIILGFLLLCGAALGIFAAGHLPAMTDENVKITALGLKKNKSERDDVFLSGFTVDGKDLPIDEIRDGKWFWIGDLYGWRNEQDPRRPENLTQSITLAVPVGRERTVNFSSGKYRGLAEIEFRGKSEIVDTGTQAGYQLPASGKRALARNECMQLAVYSAFFLVFAGISAYGACRSEKFFGWIRTNRWVLIYAGVASLQFLFAVKYSTVKSFWYDEMFEIGWSVQANSLWERMMVDIVPRPIFSGFFHIWYQIAPYGEKWLLLPYELITSVGIFIAGLCGKRLRDGKTGLFTVVFAALSTTILTQYSYEVRSYPFYFCFGAWLLLLNLKRWEHPGRETKGEIIKAAVIMTLFAGMHAYAVITVIMYFLVDLYRYFKYKFRLSNIIPYLTAAASYIPILAAAARNVPERPDVFWHGVPTIGSIINLVNYLCSDIVVVSLFFLLGISVNIIWFWTRNAEKKDGNHTSIKSEFRSYIFAVSTIQILIMFVYGRFINPNGSLWNHRYFAGILPIVLNLSADAASGLCDWVSKAGKKASLGSCAALFILLALFHSEYQNLVPQQMKLSERFREAGEWLYSQADIYNSDTIVIGHRKSTVNDAWNEYYLLQKGRRDPINIASRSQSDLLDILPNYKHIYLVTFHKDGLGKNLSKVLSDQYTLVQSLQDLPIKEYVQK